MAQDPRTDSLDLMVLQAPDEGARQQLLERALELGCVLEPYATDRDRPVAWGAGDVAPRLEDAAALCRALLEGTRDEVLVADEEGRITFASRRLASLAGADPGEVAGEPADRILGAIGLPEFEELRSMLASVSCARTEANLLEPSGTSRPVLMRGVSTSLSGGRQRFIWFITELTRIRSVERANRLLRSELETQSRLLALVSHELRTPLNVILGQLSLLERGVQGELSEDQRDSVERSSRAGHSLLALINDLIDFARLEAEELELEVVPFRPGGLLEEVAETAESLLAESDRRAVVRHGDGAPEPVNGDPDRTRQILMQLVTNAIKFGERGEITLETRKVRDGGREPGADLPAGVPFLAVSVRDTGSGIPEEDRERVFEPFQQVARVLNRSHEGPGLGLAIARRLACRQGGELTASRAKSGGSVFTLYLPLAE